MSLISFRVSIVFCIVFWVRVLDLKIFISRYTKEVS